MNNRLIPWNDHSTDNEDQIARLRHLRLNDRLRRRQRAQRAVRAELARRHAEAFAELLAEVVLRIEAAAAGDLRDTHVAALQQARRLLQPLLLQEMAEQTAGNSVEAPGDVLSRVAALLCDGFPGQLIFAPHA